VCAFAVAFEAPVTGAKTRALKLVPHRVSLVNGKSFDLNLPEGFAISVAAEAKLMKDLTIALENRPGALAEMGDALGRAGVSIEGGGAFVVNGQGVAHFLFEDGDAAREALDAAGIASVVLKGFANWERYSPDPALRLQYDLDLYCPDEAIRARDAILRLGYESIPLKYNHGNHLLVRKVVVQRIHDDPLAHAYPDLG